MSMVVHDNEFFKECYKNEIDADEDMDTGDDITATHCALCGDSENDERWIKQPSNKQQIRCAPD